MSQKKEKKDEVKSKRKLQFDQKIDQGKLACVLWDSVHRAEIFLGCYRAEYRSPTTGL